MIIFLSLRYFIIFLYGSIAWMLKNIPLRTGGGEGEMGKSIYVKGFVSSVYVRTMGEGSTFCYHGGYVLIESPL